MSKTKNNACLGFEKVGLPFIIAILNDKSIYFDGIAPTLKESS